MGCFTCPAPLTQPSSRRFRSWETAAPEHENRACQACSRRYYPTGMTVTDSCSRFLSWEGTQLPSRSTGSALLHIRLSGPVVQRNQATREKKPHARVTGLHSRVTTI
jgi:hypothetical protein